MLKQLRALLPTPGDLLDYVRLELVPSVRSLLALVTARHGEYVTVDEALYIVTGHEEVLIVPVTQPINIRLPAPDELVRPLKIIRLPPQNGIITITPSSGEINGTTSYVFTNPNYRALEVFSTGDEYIAWE